MLINDNRIVIHFTSSAKIDHLQGVTFTKNGKQVTPWRKKRMIANELRNDIKQLNNCEYVNHIFQTYELDANYYGLYDLRAKKYYLQPKNGLEKIEFHIESISVHSFQSGIHFLDIQYSLPSQNAFDILNVNYFLSEIKSNIAIILENVEFNPQLKEKHITTCTISFSEMIQRLLADFEDRGNIENDDFNYFYNRPVIYAYLYGELQETAKLSSNLGHNYKESYKISQGAVKTSQYFENSTWYYSANSVVNLSHTVEDAITNAFFEHTFTDKVSQLYFFLFLNVYHQKLFLLKQYTALKQIEVNTSTAALMQKTTEILLVEIGNYQQASLKMFFDNPSNIPHVNLYYTNLLEVFLVQDIKADLEGYISLLNDTTAKNMELLDRFQTIKQDHRKAYSDLIMLFIASIISFASLYDTFLAIIENFEIEISARQQILFALIFFLICFAIPTIFNVVRNITQIKKTKQLKQELENLLKRKQITH